MSIYSNYFPKFPDIKSVRKPCFYRVAFLTAQVYFGERGQFLI